MVVDSLAVPFCIQYMATSLIQQTTNPQKQWWLILSSPYLSANVNRTDPVRSIPLTTISGGWFTRRILRPVSQLVWSNLVHPIRRRSRNCWYYYTQRTCRLMCTEPIQFDQILSTATVAAVVDSPAGSCGLFVVTDPIESDPTNP